MDEQFKNLAYPASTYDEAARLRHEHINADELNAITSVRTSKWDSAVAASEQNATAISALREAIDELPTSIGEPGEKGDLGKSAYEVAVENGFVGTEEEWLASLQGDPGTPGRAATIRAGTVTMVERGAPAEVTNSGTDTDAVFNFKLPVSEGGGGSGIGIGIGAVDMLSIEGITDGLLIAWRDPDDLTLLDVPVSKWQSTTLVRNPDRYPESIDDGTVVLVNTVRDQYKDGYADLGLAERETYYYRLFPSSDSGILNMSDSNRISEIAGYDPFAVPAEERVFDDGTGNLSVYVKLPRFRLSDVIPGGSSDWHPAFKINGEVVPHIWIAKYEGVIIGGKAYSKKGVLPTVNITIGDAKAACEANGAGHHLATNAEWAALALWCKANGTMPDGNNNSPAEVASGSSNPSWYHNNDLSGIEGLNGNVQDWCGGVRTVNGEIQIIPDNDAAVTGADQGASSPLWKAIMPDGTLVAPGTAGTLKYNATGAPASGAGGSVQVVTTVTSSTTDSTQITMDFGNVTTSLSGAGIDLLKILGLFPIDTAAELGNDMLWMRNNGERLLVRGGTRGNNLGAGVFALGLHRDRPYSVVSFSFRAAYYDVPVSAQQSSIELQIPLINNALLDSVEQRVDLDYRLTILELGL